MNGHQTRPGDRAAAVAIDPDGIDTIATDQRPLTADPTEPGLSQRGLLSAASVMTTALDLWTPASHSSCVTLISFCEG